MIKFQCPCGASTYFDSINCMSCGKMLGLNPETWNFEFLTKQHHSYPNKSIIPAAICKNGLQYGVCNWIRDPRSQDGLCLACSFNRYIPILGNRENISRWKILELAKRRLFFNLFRLNIRWPNRWIAPEKGLLFDFLEDSRTSPNIHPAEFVSTGYSNGIITIILKMLR